MENDTDKAEEIKSCLLSLLNLVRTDDQNKDEVLIKKELIDQRKIDISKANAILSGKGKGMFISYEAHLTFLKKNKEGDYVIKPKLIKLALDNQIN